MLKYKKAYIAFALFTLLICFTALQFGETKGNSTVFAIVTTLVPHFIFWFINGIYKLQYNHLNFKGSLLGMFTTVAKLIQIFMLFFGSLIFLVSLLITILNQNLANLAFSVFGVSIFFAGITVKNLIYKD